MAGIGTNLSEMADFGRLDLSKSAMESLDAVAEMAPRFGKDAKKRKTPGAVALGVLGQLVGPNNSLPAV